MLTQIRILIRLELCNVYGLNVLRFSKDKKARRRSLGLLALWMLLLAILIFYVGSLSYGLIYLGLEGIVPAYLITISSLLIFIFGMLKAGSMIFRREGYDILCALPLPRGAVVISRLVKMYVEDLLMTFAVMLPGIAVYAWNIRPDADFYLTGILGVWSIPLLPMTASIFMGTVISGISSRMRHKSLIAAGLTILAVLGMMYGWSRLSAMSGVVDWDALKSFSASIMMLLERIYPPAVWLGGAIVRGDVLHTLLCAGLSLAVFAAVAAGIVLCFRKICQRLYSSFAKHDYQVGTLRERSVLTALCRREFQRYFSSSIYVINTIIGPIMVCVLSGALLVTDMEEMKGLLPFPIDIVSLIPFVLAGVFCVMTTTATSISMEGKNWWIVKSLPLSVKNILDGKILMNLLLLLPFYLLSELLLIFALKPSLEEFLWLVLIPAVIILFSCVYGITINLHFPVLEWESEVSVVKQSASAILGGMGGCILGILCAVVVGGVPGGATVYLKAGICVIILAATVVLYRKNNRFDIYGRI